MTNQIFMMTDEAIDALVDRICLKLKDSYELFGNSQEDELLGTQEASKLIKLAVPTIYGLVHKNEIPHSKRGKKLYFNKSELLEWINERKHTSKQDLVKKVDEYMFKKKFQQ